jgi:hypothetical protein
MTRSQRRSKSRHHNWMKKQGYRWFRRGWWKPFRWVIQIPLEEEDDE